MDCKSTTIWDGIRNPVQHFIKIPTSLRSLLLLNNHCYGLPYINHSYCTNANE